MSEIKRQSEIDWLRGFAIFLVVLGHAIIVFPINLYEIAWCKYLINLINSIHMPLFFAISGYCFSMRGNYGAYLMKRAKRLLIPYFVCSFAGIIPRLIFPTLVNGTEPVSDTIKGIIFYGHGYWFLYTLFLIDVIFPLVNKGLQRNKTVCLIGVVALAIVKNVMPSILTFSSVAYYMFFFVMGYEGRRIEIFERLNNWLEQGNIKKNIGIMVIGIIVVLLGGYVHGKWNITILHLIQAVIGIAVSMLVTVVCPWLLKRFDRYSKYSLALYLLNGYWLVISRTLAVNILGINTPILIIGINVIIDFWISYIFIHYILENIPIVRELVGIQKVK